MRGKGLRYAVVVLVAVLLLSMGAGSVSADTVTGVPGKYSKEINYLIGENIIKGYPDGDFHGDDKVTRAQAAVMVGRMLGLSGEKRSTDFPDVNKGLYASGYIQSAKDKGIITGFPEGDYRPNKSMTRAEMAYLIVKALRLETKSDVTFTGIPKSSKLYDYVNKLSTAGISEGFPSGEYKPDRIISRTEFSLFVARGMNKEFKVSSGTEEPMEVLEKQIVTADFLNVRNGAGSNNQVVGKIYTGDIVSVYKKEGSWYYISSGNIKGYVHSAYLMDKPSKTYKVAIDPGHGERDPGASANGIVEKELVLDVSKKTRKFLENAGMDVVMTRQSDWYPSLSGRVAIAERNNATEFVSIHANAASEGANGVETFYYASGMSGREFNSYKLAKFINERLYKEMDMTDRGVKNGNFHVIRETSLTAVLTEIGFLTNKGDAGKLKTQHYREAAARAIALGVMDYYNWKE
ncbi:N-acetylmuramoyl-L-alanine amidase [Salimicrobium salexigens]|uniref:N-acetylmuramoyl-L-alanine amidase n=1 Tax=Salimicrobium salexigens TaxID=908941 RepID=A0ABY1KV68_9BACI|nr:N-acetylmuramoyl-L-alanine amidase [Salimicrobium salexigens]SIS82537.1 N-acetylmuramoyl-L-alanine amidase [Salimicrobium salexigens]